MRKRNFILCFFLIWLSLFICHSEAIGDVSKTDLIEASTTLANYMEEYRHLPETVQVGSTNMTTSQFLYVAASSIQDLHQNAGNGDYPVPQCLDALDPYPAIEFNDDFYKSPLNQETYMAFINDVISYLDAHNQAPDYFVFNDAQIRYCAAVHYCSSILRFYDFFGFLPQSMDIKIISPRNLVPAEWNTPETEELQAYTSAITYHVNVSDNMYYRYCVIDYNTFKLAKEIVGDLALYPAMESIYNWVKVDTWLRWGYGQIGHAPFRGPGLRRAREAWSMRLTTSGDHVVKMNALYRALGIPAYLFYVYNISEGRWVNTDVHSTFGADPNLDNNGQMYEGYEDSPFPSVSDDFINEIRSLVNYKSAIQNPDTDFRGLFINASDVTTYGVDTIIQAAKKGNFRVIILTVKTPYGDVYADQDVMFPEEFSEPIWIGGGGAGQSIEPVKRIELDPLFSAAHAEGIEVHIALNILYDYLTGRKQYNANMDEHPNWSQWDGETDRAFYTGMICPCVSEYRELIQTILEAYLERYPIDGVVIMGLAWFQGRAYNGEPKYGENPHCDPYKTQPDWYENMLVDYLEELVTTIHNVKEDCYISFLSTTLGKGSHGEGASVIPTRYCGQDFEKLSQHVNNFIINIGGHYWLTANLYDQDQLFSYDFIKPVHDLDPWTGPSVSIAFNVRDEWEYPPEFFNSLYNYCLDIGLKGFHLYSKVSGWGEWGPAFTESQWDKIQHMDLIQDEIRYIPDQVCDVPTGKSAGCGAPPLGNISQSFTPSVSSLGAVDLRLRVGGSFPFKGYETTIRIRAGSPDGPVVGTQTVFIPGPQSVGLQRVVRFEFSPPLLLTAGETYFIEWLAPPEGGRILTWMIAEGNPYTGGNAFGCTGIRIINEDRIFTTYTPALRFWDEIRLLVIIIAAALGIALILSIYIYKFRKKKS